MARVTPDICTLGTSAQQELVCGSLPTEMCVNMAAVTINGLRKRRNAFWSEAPPEVLAQCSTTPESSRCSTTLRQKLGLVPDTIGLVN